MNMGKPSVEGPLGNPPFEKPSIAKVNNHRKQLREEKG